MAKVRQSLLVIEGNVGDGVVYKSGNKWIFRRKRGSVKPATLNEACKQSSNNLQKTNPFAVCLRKAILPHLDHISKATYWQDLLSHVRKHVNTTGIELLMSYRNYKISREQQVSSILAFRHETTADWEAGNLTFSITDHGLTHFKTRTRKDSYRLTVVALFFHSPDHFIQEESIVFDNLSLETKLTGTKVKLPIPPNAKAALIVMKVSALLDGAPSKQKTSNAISIVDAVGR